MHETQICAPIYLEAVDPLQMPQLKINNLDSGSLITLGGRSSYSLGSCSFIAFKNFKVARFRSHHPVYIVYIYIFGVDVE